MEWPKQSPQGWLLLILDQLSLSLSHPSIPFFPRHTLCRFRRGNTLYCGFYIHYYWVHPLTLCVSSMPVYRRIYSTCASGAPILNLLDNQEIARPFLTYDPHLPHGAMHTLWVGYASTHEWLSGHHIYPRIYESNYQLAFCNARHSLHILSENYILVPTSLRRALNVLNANPGAKHTGRSRRTNTDYPETQSITHNSA